MNSVLVTGGTGQLGHRVARALASDGHTGRIQREFLEGRSRSQVLEG